MESTSSPVAGAFFDGLLLVFGIFYLAIIALIVIANWKIYEKAGKPGWACLVPIYGFLVFLQIVGKPWWWIFLILIPVANIIFLIMLANSLSKSFGQGAGFTVGMIFLPYVFLPILGFSKSYKYIGPGGVPTGSGLGDFENYQNPFGSQQPSPSSVPSASTDPYPASGMGYSSQTGSSSNPSYYPSDPNQSAKSEHSADTNNSPSPDDPLNPYK